MVPSATWITLLCVAAASLLIFAQMLAGERKAWESHPHRRLDDRTPGLAWFTGRVVPIKAIESAFLKRTSVYFSLRVEHYGFSTALSVIGSSTQFDQWLLVHGDGRREDFVLTDDAGQAKVEPAKAAISLKPSVESSLREADPLMISRLEAAGVRYPQRLTAEDARVTEELIAPGDVVSVLGTLVPQDAPGGKDPGRIAPLMIWSEDWLKDNLRAERRARIVLRSTAAAALVAAAVMAAGL